LFLCGEEKEKDVCKLFVFFLNVGGGGGLNP